MYNNALLKKFLPVAKGIQTLSQEEVDKMDKNTLQHLAAMGLVYIPSKVDLQRDASLKPTVRNNNKNMFTSKFYFSDFTSQIPAWKKTECELDLGIVNAKLVGYTLCKCADEDFGAILNKDGDTVLYIKHFRDSRAPWVEIPGDDRKVQFALTNLQMPQDINSLPHRLSGWSKEEDGHSYKYNGKLTIRDFQDVPFYITKKILKMDDLVNRKPDVVLYGFKERMAFRRGENFLATVKGTMDDQNIQVEIKKDTASLKGIILLNGSTESSGSVEMVNGRDGKFQLSVKLNKDVQIDHIDIINGAQSAAMSPVH